MKQFVCIIPSHNQCKFIPLIISALEKQIIRPDLIFFILDRCTDNSKEILSSINSKINIKYIEKQKGIEFDAGATRDFGLDFIINKYGMPKNVLFIDGDCIPNELIIKEHLENLSRIDAPVISCGRRRLENENGEIINEKRDLFLRDYFSDSNLDLIFTEHNGKLLHSAMYHDILIVTYSCNIAFNDKAIILCKKVNKMLNGCNRVFNSSFDGNWGSEDNFVGQILFLTTGYIFSCSKYSFVNHCWHPTREFRTLKNYRKWINLRSRLKELILKGNIETDNILKIEGNEINCGFDFLEYSTQFLLFPGTVFIDKLFINNKNNFYTGLVDSFISFPSNLEDKIKKNLTNMFFGRNFERCISDQMEIKLNNNFVIDYKIMLKELLNRFMTIREGELYVESA